VLTPRIPIGKTLVEPACLFQKPTFGKAYYFKSGNLSIACDIGEGRLNHVKLHGALYNDAAVDPRLANLVVELLQNHFPTCILYAPYGSLLASIAAEKGVPFKYEVFADRRYQGDYTLVPRSTANACIDDLNQIRQQVSDMVWYHRIKTIDGKYLTIQADTVCVHGDHPEALSIATMLHGMFAGQNAEPL